MKPALVLTLLLSLGCDSKPAPPTKQDIPAPQSETTAATATSSKPVPTPPPPAPRGPEEPLNVLLLTIDSMRADMPWAGYSRDIAPNLTALAKKSTVYTNAYSASSYTAKSVAGMLTSRVPSTIYRSGSFFAEFAEANLSFSEVLQEQGIRTLAGHGHMYFMRGKKLEQGFDEWSVVKGIGFDSSTDKNVTSEKISQLAIKMLNKPENQKQFFMWLHYMDPHDQYIQHEESPVFGKHNRDRYDSEMFYTDLHIGKLLEFAKAQSWWKDTAIIISADHGEAFGEHGMYKHAFALWEVLTRVPIVLYAPGVKAQNIEQRRSTLDIAPTVLELMGIKKMPPSFMGSSLVAEAYGAEPPSNREPIILDLPEDQNNPDRHAIISGDYKLIVHGPGLRRLELYNLKADPGENTDLAEKEPARLEELKGLYLKAWEGLEVIEPYGGMKLRSGRTARGRRGPQKSDTKVGNKPAP